MSHRIHASLFLMLVAMSLAGCLGPRRDDFVSTAKLSLADRSDRADTCWEAIKDTLRGGGFRLDRVDRQAGVITTFPVTSQHFFELWRHDVNTDTDFWEASLGPIRRRAQVSVSRDDNGNWIGLSVEVRKERFSSADRQFNASGFAYLYFGSSLPSTMGEAGTGANRDRWLDRGLDPAMAAYLLEKMLVRADFAQNRAAVLGEG